MSQNPKNEEIEQESRKPEDEFVKYDTDFQSWALG